MPNLIHCSESGCNQFISDPCGTITSLLETRNFLEEITSEFLPNTIPYAKTQEQLGIVDTQIQNYFTHDKELYKIVITEFRTSKKINFRRNVPKILTLECSKGHRNVYTVDC
jgi:hypothetical protein